MGACSSPRAETMRIVGDTPVEVASSIMLMETSLDVNRQAAFGEAVATLTLVVSDKMDGRTYGNISPEFVRLVQGRSADQVIQLAETYRLSVPMDRP
jgi:hypothetical protein